MGTENTMRRLLRETEVANHLGVQRRTLQQWRLFGRGPRYRKLSGGAVRYDPRELENWLSSQPSGGDPLPAAHDGGAA